MNEFKLVMGEDGVFREYKEPFATVECETEEDFELIKTAVEFYEKHKWISANDELPLEADEFVLVVVNRQYKNIKFEEAIQIADYSDEGWIIDGFEDWGNLDVTHWMPLPEPPKMEESTNEKAK